MLTRVIRCCRKISSPPIIPRPQLSAVHLRTWRVLVALVLLLNSIRVASRGEAFAQIQPRTSVEGQLIVSGTSIEGELGAGQTKHYRVVLGAGEFLRVIVEHYDVELSVVLLTSDSNLIAQMDGSYGDRETKSLSIKAEVRGEYGIELRVTKDPLTVGRFKIDIEGPRAPTEADISRLSGEKAFMAAQKLVKKNTDESRQQALDSYKQALVFWRDAGEPYYEAKTLLYLARTAWDLSGRDAATKVIDFDTQMIALCRRIGDRRGEAFALRHLGYIHITFDPFRARDYLMDSLALWQADGDRLNEAITINNIGGTYESAGDVQVALEHYSASLTLRRALKDVSAMANALNNIGQIYDRLGEAQEALKYYQQVIDLLGAKPNMSPKALAAAFNNTGYVYLAMGEPETALEYCSRSLPLQRAANYHLGENGTLLNIGNAYLQLREPRRALEFYKEAEAIALRFLGDNERAYTLTYRGEAYVSLGKTQTAMKEYTAALGIFRASGALEGEALVLTKMGDVVASQSQHARARGAYDRALELWRKVKDPRGEAAALFGVARAERALGNLIGAHNRAEDAIKIVETLRSVISRDLRSSYLAAVRDYYDLDIDLLMQLHMRDPLKGFDSRALQLSERARARSFLESLGEVSKEIREGVDPKLIDREQSVQRQIEAKSQLQVQRLKDKETEPRARIEKELKSLLAERREIEERILAESPNYAALVRPQPVSVDQIQNQLLDPETLLLEYALGEQRSYLWLVSTSQVSTFQLPGRAVIESLATGVYKLVSSAEAAFPAGKAAYWNKANALSQMILGPAAAQLGDKRLLIVAEGALQYVSFASLPVPQTRGRTAGPRISDPRPMIEEHEIIGLASVSVVAALRSDLATRRPASKSIAVFADPVFGSDDERLQSGRDGSLNVVRKAEESDVKSALREFARYDIRLGRLKNSRTEAEAIQALSPDAAIALDFDANLTNARSAELASYRIVHFATHGLLDSNQPDLSCIALSMVNKQGAPQDGFLLLNNIYNLRLSADLVVLSACSTALGKDIKGEGLVGLTRGFMYAGAARVMASLWSVDDQKTAELMKRFYSKVLREHMQPAAALRAAQLEMWRSENNSPYYWGAFVLQGEWRDRRPGASADRRR